MNPVIGIVICGFMNGRQFVPHPYVRAVESSGGIPLIVPRCTDTEVMDRFLSICDGFLFCGGDDITPLLFGEELLTTYGKTDWRTDLFHIELMKKILQSSLPVLGICRGMQVMNLALGGSIYQDISLRPGNALNHMQLSEDRSDPCHKVTISKNSILYNICGTSCVTNTFHHQCIKKLGVNLKITGIASDGIIEAIESLSHPFAVGVQWHPECMYQDSEPMQNLFMLFIQKSENIKKIL